MKTLCLLVRLKGGLGNQLFQYATARSLAHRHHINFLFLDTEKFTTDRLGRKFSLQYFNIEGKALENNFLRNLFRKNSKANSLVRRFGLLRNIDEKGLVLHRFQSKLAVLCSLNGYWQSDHYFVDIRSQLLVELTPTERPSYPEWMNKGNTVAVHVRRTDYLQQPRFGFLGKDYYHRAMELVKGKLEAPFFIFFSDDLSWCEAEFNGPNVHFAKEEEWINDYLQLHLMSKCKHQIIANSSFSWWAAWLNNHPDKIVIRPAQPFKDKTLFYENYYPDEWIALENKL